MNVKLVIEILTITDSEIERKKNVIQYFLVYVLIVDIATDQFFLLLSVGDGYASVLF